VFTSHRGEPHRRSNFGRRALLPATNGTQHLIAPAVRLAPAKPGLTFHGLRHSHKTWMIADGVPEVAQARRLGHILGDRIQETYSHVAAEVEHRLLEAPQRSLGQGRRRQSRPTGVADLSRSSRREGR
jgi:integrase